MRAGGIVAVVLMGALACSSAPPTEVSGTAQDAGADALPTEAGRIDDASMSTKPSGAVVIVDEPDAACTAHAGAERMLYAAAAAPAFDRLGRVGARRIATSTHAGGFALFDADGANAGPVVVLAGSANVAASEGTSIGVAELAGTEIRYARCDPNGAQQGTTLALDTAMTGGMLIGGGGGESLVVWSGGGRMHARGVSGSGAAAGATFDFAEGSVVTSFTGSVVRADASFAIAWSAPSEGGLSRTFFMRATTMGPVGQAFELTGLGPEHEVVQLTKTSTGFAALVQQRSPSRVVVVLLDSVGLVDGPAHRLLGSTYAFAISARGDELGILARRTGGEAQLRRLGPDGRARGASTCFEVVPDGSFSAGLDADGTGYAVVRRTSLGAEVLTRVDTP